MRVEQPPEFHPEGDVWVHTMLLLERLPLTARRLRRRWRGGRCCMMWGTGDVSARAGGSDSGSRACGGGGADC